MPSSPEPGESDSARVFHRLVRARHMVRSFDARPVESEMLDEILLAALGGPSAGNAQGLHLVVMVGAEAARYWQVTLPESERASFPWPGMLRAPVLIAVYVDPDAYVRRYSEPDKVHTGLGRADSAWPVPYWWVDAGAAIENLLLATTANGLAACLFGQFEHETAVKAELGVPPQLRAAGTVAVGHADPNGDRLSGSARRGRPQPSRHIHRGRW